MMKLWTGGGQFQGNTVPEITEFLQKHNLKYIYDFSKNMRTQDKDALLVDKTIKNGKKKSNKCHTK